MRARSSVYKGIKATKFHTMYPIYDLLLCFFSKNYMGGVIGTPLYTLEMMRRHEIKKQKSHNINMLWLLKKAI